MNSDLKSFLNKHNFHIRKYAFLGKSKIIETDNGIYSLKEKKNNNKIDIYKYLESNQFNNFIQLFDLTDRYEIHPYIENIYLSKEEKALKCIHLISLLHNKTTHFKNITLDELKIEYESKIKELENISIYYNNKLETLEEIKYLSPSNYLLLRNISCIFIALDNSKYFLNLWYKIMESKLNKRCCFIHNNLDLNHLINNDNLYLINWDYATIENPVYDLYSLYQNVYNYVDFSILFNIYNNKYQLFNEELYFFFYLISKPSIVKEDNTEINKVIDIYRLTNYLINTNSFVLKAYSKEQNTKSN